LRCRHDLPRFGVAVGKFQRGIGQKAAARRVVLSAGPFGNAE